MFTLSLFLALFVIAIIIVRIDNPLTALGVRNDFLTYENAEYGVTMQYPREWEEVDNEILGGYFYDTKNAIVEFLPSNESAYFRQDDQSTHESLALVVANYENNSGSVTKQLSDFGNQRKSFVKLTCPDFQILYENTNATLSNDSPAHRMVYKYSHGGIVYMATEIWTIKNGKSYLLAFGGQESSYVNFLPEIEKVFKSFKIIA